MNQYLSASNRESQQINHLMWLGQADNLAAELGTSGFTQHGLEDINSASLMNRVDTKFLLPISQLNDLLMQLKPKISLLNINGHVLAKYENIYFDTPDLTFYHQHHRGKLNRTKVRRRRYADHDLAFFELKLKNNKNRTIKTREQIGNEDESSQFQRFCQQPELQPFNDLRATQLCNYQRLSLANERLGERITIDMNCQFIDLNNHNEIVLTEVCIVELKQHKLCLHSPLYQILKKMSLRPSSFSKYCLGTALLNEGNNQIKYNRFKPTILALKRHHGVN